ncbi:MAG: chemotaxis protein CheX [Bryobacteraceae bacterium]|nr:chemotaxis protein CheX [Bryobacteraceae bacterium]HEU0138178.1 chemotaxis protein CheX [Bryobacteraceae bacterium]
MRGLDHSKVVHAICDSTREVFSTMLGMEIEAGEFYFQQSVPGENEGVVSLIGLAGDWAGSGSISCSPEFARHISSALLMTEFASVDEEVLDAVAEVTNMIIGNVKNSLEEDLGPMGLSIPTVIFGRNFTTRSVGNSDWIVVPFQSGNEQMKVQICVAPSKTKHPPRPGFANDLALA